MVEIYGFVIYMYNFVFLFCKFFIIFLLFKNFFKMVVLMIVKMIYWNKWIKLMCEILYEEL